MLFFFLLFLILPVSVFANGLLDSDGDGIPDKDEIEIYKTDPFNEDTDGDGYDDRTELLNGYSPLDARPIKLENSDYDGDGLSDRMELKFGTDIKNPDTDGDGFSDGDEVFAGFDPLEGGGKKLSKRIDISTYSQKLFYFLGGVLVYEFPISSGIYDSTPKGEFKVENKSPKAWSPYGLWMPYWMAITADGKYGIHELPIWPNGYREGENHLGTAVSHGCVRLGTKSAELIYKLTDIGTVVNIY